jgi:hypothetical protein
MTLHSVQLEAGDHRDLGAEECFCSIVQFPTAGVGRWKVACDAWEAEQQAAACVAAAVAVVVVGIALLVAAVAVAAIVASCYS